MEKALAAAWPCERPLNEVAAGKARVAGARAALGLRRERLAAKRSQLMTLRELRITAQANVCCPGKG